MAFTPITLERDKGAASMRPGIPKQRTALARSGAESSDLHLRLLHPIDKYTGCTTSDACLPSMLVTVPPAAL